MTSPRITLAMLRGACKEQRDIFRKKWPKGADATLENVLRAQALGLDLSWGTRWFTPEALAEYDRQRAPLLAEYERQRALLLAEYERQRALLWAEYERQVAPLRAEYARQAAPLWDEYERQAAQLWVEAFLKSQGERA